MNGGLGGISLLSSRMKEDEIELRAIYYMQVPIRMFGVQQYRILQTAISRKWIGNISLKETSETGEWVYITPSGKAYHKSRNCSYLDLSIRSVSSLRISEKRNLSGGKYKSCPICRGKGGYGQMLYITDYGNVYHTTLTCSGLKRSIYMVRISEVGDRHCCSKCGHTQ